MSIDEAASKNTGEFRTEGSSKLWSKEMLFRIILVLGTALFALGAFSFVSTGSTGTLQTSGSTYPLQGAIKGDCEACSFLECKRSMCDAKNVPMVCTKGAAKDGCADTALAWMNSYVCDTCCDISECDSAKPPTDDKDLPFTCKPCTFWQCRSGKACSDDSPYICLSGGGTGGCSDDPFHWPTRLNNICNSCCDATEC